MSLQIAVAHTGQRLDADPVGFNSVDALKQWIATVVDIPPEHQILLTPRGKHAKLQTLLTEKELFVYDRELSSVSQATSTEAPLPEPFTPDDPPDTLSSHTDLRAWQTLFQARRDWAFAVLEQALSMSRVASQTFAEQATIEKATQVAVGNPGAHMKGLEQKHREAKEWFDGVEKEAVENLRRLDADYGQLGAIPAKGEFIQFLAKELRSAQTAQSIRNTSANRAMSLQDFLDFDSIKQATGVSKTVRESFEKHLADMGAQAERIGAEYNELQGAAGQSQSRSLMDDSEEPVRLYNEIDQVAKKVNSDLGHIMGLPSESKSVAQVSKMALLHTRNFLPAIKEYSIEMSDLIRRSVEQKNNAVRNAVESMRGVADIGSNIARLHSELDNINFPQEGMAAFELISLVGRLPFVYGALLVESVRRREWAEKMQRDTSSLAEEMATFQEEEERRRKRWLKQVSDVVNLDAVQTSPLGFEMNIQPEKTYWPEVTRDELNDYHKILQGLEGQSAEAETLAQTIKDLDRPTRQQVKRAKAFKMGSVHEPAFGRNSQLMLRGDDELRVLKEANAKLEDELRGSKSRVRRLEDVLHRQNHINRLSIGSGMPLFGPQSPADPSTPTIDAPSPVPMVDHSRRSSVSSRRFSTNQGQDDKRRIVRLEQELATEREVRARLEKEAQAKKDEEATLQGQIEEAVATKAELMENMKAQQKEFADERRSLEEEIQTYKSKIEETEDELDRVLGSRDHERTGVDAKIQELVGEVERVRRHAAEQSKEAHKRVADLRTELEERKRADDEQYESLSNAFIRLSPNTTVPGSITALIMQIEDLAQRTSDHLHEVQQAVAIAKAENESARRTANEQETALKCQLANEETTTLALREQLDKSNAKVASITTELDEERHHLHDLRSKFAEGETGSEALRKRVEEEEERVGKLQIELAEERGHSNSLDVELMHLQKKVLKYEEFDSSRTHERLRRAKELSKRAYSQQDRLLRLVDSLGYVITFEDGTMTLHRASKVGNSTTLTNTMDLNRSTTTPSPTPLKQQLENYADLAFLHWTESTDAEEEDQRYHELMDNLNRFDLDTFCEFFSKRMRDIEYTARKFKHETRAYREKAKTLQTESHNKIAYRSFKEGDLALFLPTRNQATRPWAAFNVGAPHFFLREEESHRLQGRDWLVARISKVEERVVDLSKTMDTATRASLDGRSITSSSAVSFEDDNPFELSDGLRWYLIEAAEEKPGAPGGPGLGKSAAAAAVTRIDGQGKMEQKAAADPAKTLGKSLDSRRSSGTSRKSVPVVAAGNRNSMDVGDAAMDSGLNSNTATRGASPAAGPGPSHLRESEASGANSVDRLLQEQQYQVRKDHLWGP
ncbi:oligomeric, coiled-coil, peripheral membrane protein [Didymosphaeria variabile]|uniref:Autophagy-related protein 11 n=1 Tax=Didymosphaeria variabile TaxID=1932322 RepID=A0A9W8XI95_9PLEO|nr:oligomeric, coiled-coil, peripheral membrane protein [Didymosphaeria variabile]KAJ4349891.1 oligomeric, coiled-coil, peripheral membrane protein [Didymosphaeria variabile]